MSTTIHDLPLEIIQRIMRTAYPVYCLHHTQLSESQQFFFNASLVCRGWKLFAQAELWSFVNVSSKNMAQFSAAGPGLSPVKILQIEEVEDADPAVLLALPQRDSRPRSPMAFSFGAPAKPAAAFGGFGTPASAPAPAGSLFGQAPQQGGLFGSAAPAPSLFGQSAASPGLFGAPAAPATGMFGAPAAPAAGGLFGAQPAAGGGMFGAPAPAAGGSLFGSAPATGGLFGAAPATPAGGLFGQPAATGGGLFGASQAPAAGGLFGAPSATPSLFGAPQQPTSLFGASQPAATPSLFGAPAASGSLFGAPPATPSLFGAPPAPATSLFGQSQPSLFGQPTVNPAPLFGQSQPASSSLFGAKPSLFGTSSLAQSTAPPVPRLGDPYPPPNPDDPSIESRIEAIKAAWDPTTPRCQFQTYFYNMPAPPNTVAQYNSPPVGLDPKAWARAVRENPDPEHLVPAIAIGFPAIQKRIEGQARQSVAHQALLGEIHDHLNTLSSTHSLTTSLRTLRASQNAAVLSARLLALTARLSVLSPSRGTSLRKDEEDLRVALESMSGEVEGVKVRSNELWAGVGVLKARKAAGGNTEWGVADEEGLRKVLEILASQQAGLNHLTKTLTAAAPDVELMNKAFGLKTLTGGKVVSR